jgi:DNA repair protein RadC
MAERLYQLGFDEQFRVTHAADVTPEQFTGLIFPSRSEEIPLRVSDISRFVREVKETVPIGSPAEAGQYLLEHIYSPFDRFDQEELWVLLLNIKHHITHEVMVYRGTINSVLVRPAELLKEAVRVNAPVIMLSHNHPSGDPTPSPEDVQVTVAASQAAKLLGIEVLDHLVVGTNRWVSLRDRGLGFSSSTPSGSASYLYTAE